MCWGLGKVPELEASIQNPVLVLRCKMLLTLENLCLEKAILLLKSKSVLTLWGSLGFRAFLCGSS